MTAKDIIIGTMLTLRNLAVSWEEEDKLALASSLVVRKAIKAATAGTLIAAANPMAAIVVTVVIVLVVIVIIITLSQEVSIA